MPLTPQQARSLAEQLLDDEDPADASSEASTPACDAQDQGLPQYIGARTASSASSRPAAWAWSTRPSKSTRAGWWP